MIFKIRRAKRFECWEIRGFFLVFLWVGITVLSMVFIFLRFFEFRKGLLFVGFFLIWEIKYMWRLFEKGNVSNRSKVYGLWVLRLLGFCKDIYYVIIWFYRNDFYRNSNNGLKIIKCSEKGRVSFFCFIFDLFLII